MYQTLIQENQQCSLITLSHCLHLNSGWRKRYQTLYQTAMLDTILQKP